MTDPAMLAIATAATAAMAGTYAQSMSEASRQAMGALVARIRQRLRGRPEDEAILGTIVEDPGAEAHRATLAEILVRLSAEDPAFRDELLRLADEAGVRVEVPVQTTNTVNARSIGKVITAGRDITIGGDLSL